MKKQSWIDEMTDKLVKEYWIDVVSGKMDMEGRVREFYLKALNQAFEKGRKQGIAEVSKGEIKVL